MRALQAWFDQHVDREGAVVGAQGPVVGHASQLKSLVGAVYLLAVADGGGRRRVVGRATIAPITRKHPPPPPPPPLCFFFPVARVSRSIGVFVDLGRCREA